MNPNNIVSLYGTVESRPEFLKDQKGTEFAVKFELATKRSYRNKDGAYAKDPIPVKYKFDEARQPFAHTIEQGDLLQVSGCIRIEPYKGEKLMYVLTDSLSFDEETRRRKYAKENGNKVVSAEFDIDLPLPL